MFILAEEGDGISIKKSFQHFDLSIKILGSDLKQWRLGLGALYLEMIAS